VCRTIPGLTDFFLGSCVLLISGPYDFLGYEPAVLTHSGLISMARLSFESNPSLKVIPKIFIIFSSGVGGM